MSNQNSPLKKNLRVTDGEKFLVQLSKSLNQSKSSKIDYDIISKLDDYARLILEKRKISNKTTNTNIKQSPKRFKSSIIYESEELQEQSKSFEPNQILPPKPTYFKALKILMDPSQSIIGVNII